MGRGDAFAKGQTSRAWLKNCAPASPIELELRFSSSRVMFFCHKSNEQTQVRAKWSRNAWEIFFRPG